jgi:NAD(P)-dependent dehydrogenase (short-subunit alcohol dehydrogenase family)
MSASNERVAIVAGAGGELGRATAEKLAAAGFTVVGVDRSEEGLKELPDSIRREAADPTDPAAARSVVRRRHLPHPAVPDPQLRSGDQRRDHRGRRRAAYPGLATA